MKPNLIVLILFVLLSAPALAQVDSTLEALQDIPLKYISSIDKKVDKYSQRISSKTIKTLEKLSRWEAKIRTSLQKVNPEAAGKLFGDGQPSFSSLLQKIKQGQAVAANYKSGYDKYRDDLTTSLKYLSEKKEQINTGALKKLTEANKKLQQLNEEEDQSEAIQAFIKERKKQLLTEAFQYLGKNKYLGRINREAWYYAETMKNYKELFQDEKKAEQAVKGILDKIPAFQKFMRQNSMLAGLFAQPGDVASAAGSAGLQTRSSLQTLIQGRIPSGGPDAQQLVDQNIQAGKAKMKELQEKLLNQLPGGGGDVPELDFKPNMQKTKTFLQRIEYGSNLQFGKSNSLIPGTMDIALTVGYKLNDKSTAGIGGGYKMGLGTIDNIRLSNQGINLRSFLDWRLKKQLFLTGGMELNYLAGLPAADPLHQAANTSKWQQSALAGISKKIGIKTKWFKETKLQLLYDFLAKQHVPVSQQVLFRVGYSF